MRIVSSKKAMTAWMLATALVVGVPLAASAETVLRIGMTAGNVPTTTGQPDNGFEGMRFLGYPVFESLVLWDLSKSDVRADLRAGLAESWEQYKGDPKTYPKVIGPMAQEVAEKFPGHVIELGAVLAVSPAILDAMGLPHA